jgi:N-acetyl-anhydromuramyl-L-alanine amidase AmpD
MPKINETINSPSQSGRNGKKPQLIVCHICDGTYDGTKAWFLNAGADVSSHFIVAKDGRICQCVPLEKAAWCNGTSALAADSRFYGNSTVPLIKKLGGNANEYSVSIEFEGFYKDAQGALTPAQIEAAVWLIGHSKSEIQRIYGHEIELTRDYVVGHFEISPKTRANCPGQKFQWNEIMAWLRANEAAEREEVPAAKPIYRVQVGAFGVKANAENMLKSLKTKGFDGFIVEA